MATGLWTLASLLVVAGASGTDHWATNQRSLSVPIKFVERRSDVRQLILYVSSDQGKSWSESAVAAPDKESFPFYALTDGMYWMKLCIVSKDGTRSPSDISKGPPALKILVDTLKPVVRIASAERQGDGIVVRWEIQEDHPDRSSLKMEYRAGDDPTQQWYTVPIEPELNGSTRFRFPGSGPVAIRIQIRDTAGNSGQDIFEMAGIGGGPVVVQASGTSPGAPAVLPSVPMNPTTTRMPAPAPPNATWENPNAHPPLPAPLLNEPAHPTFTTIAPAHNPNAVQAIPTAATAMNPRVVATSETHQVIPVSTTPPQETIRKPRGMLPTRQIVSSPQVSLQFDVKKVGPSGIGRVDLFISQDEGQSWSQLTSRPNAESPLTVELPGEGVFGLRLVVYSRAGRGKMPPRPGDLPEMVVEVDQTAPLCRLNHPEPDLRQQNALLLTWSVTDANLTPTPITLEWSETSTGPWYPIVNNHINSGRYSWNLPPNIPSHVFLRLTARDTAGNVSPAVTPEPVLVDLSEPEARIIGIIGTPNNPSR